MGALMGQTITLRGTKRLLLGVRVSVWTDLPSNHTGVISVGDKGDKEATMVLSSIRREPIGEKSGSFVQCPLMNSDNVTWHVREPQRAGSRL